MLERQKLGEVYEDRYTMIKTLGVRQLDSELERERLLDGQFSTLLKLSQLIF